MTGTTTPQWGRLVRSIRACRRCPLGAVREHAVVYRGGERPLAVLIGEAPGAEEDRQGLPFVGRSGHRLDAALAAAGIAPEEVGIVNLIKCRPPGNRFSRVAEGACRPFLDRQLALLAPRLLVPLGARALRALCPGAPPITLAAGRLRREGDRVLFPMLHPAAALHDPRRREQWSRDAAALGRTVARLRAESL